MIGYVNYYTAGNTSVTTINEPSLVVIDRWALVVFAILFFAYQIGTIIWMYLVPWKKRRIMFGKDDLNRSHFESNFDNSRSTFIDGL